MPFPLAHPAAVLPLRRFCPRFLSFPALVVGSLCPDVAYLAVGQGLDDFSHTLLGSIAFCLPVGVLILAMFYLLASRTAARIPAPYAAVLRRSYQRPPGSPLMVVSSLLIGAWTHFLLDSFTHADSWVVAHLPILHSPVAIIGGRTFRVCHLLWYGCSFVGVAWVLLAVQTALMTTQDPPAPATRTSQWLTALLVATLVFPIELAHHLIHGKLGLAVVSTATLLLAVGVLLMIAPRRPDPGEG